MVFDGASAATSIASLMMNGMCCYWQMQEEDEKRDTLRNEMRVEYARQRMLDRKMWAEQLRSHEENMFESHDDDDDDSDDASAENERRRRLLSDKKKAYESSSGRCVVHENTSTFDQRETSPTRGQLLSNGATLSKRQQEQQPPPSPPLITGPSPAVKSCLANQRQVSTPSTVSMSSSQTTAVQSNLKASPASLAGTSSTLPTLGSPSFDRISLMDDDSDTEEDEDHSSLVDVPLYSSKSSEGITAHVPANNKRQPIRPETSFMRI